jgi:hypothetical protein
MQTETLEARISTVKFDGYKVELSVNIKGKPVARLSKLVTVGKNKGTWKLINGYYFATEARREEWVRERITNIKANLAHDVAQKAAKAAAIGSHDFKVGDALYASWGYDQTNIDFFEVIEILPKSVKVRPISQIMVDGSEGFMSESVKPAYGVYTGEVETKLVKAYVDACGTDHYNVCNGRHSLSKYTYGDRGLYQSHYA